MFKDIFCKDWGLFSEIRSYGTSEISSMWNICLANVKYACSMCRNEFYFTWCAASNFTIYEVNYFTASRRAISLKLIVVLFSTAINCKCLFQWNLPLRASEIRLRRVKCDNSREMFAARTRANFISHCDEGAIFHVCRKANISHPASAGYFTGLCL